MKILFLSPHFPPHYELFCQAVKAKGGAIYGVGDITHESLSLALSTALDDYVSVPDLEDYDQIHRAVALLIHRHGRFDHLDSLNEHWLETEAKLREDFNIPGLRPAKLACARDKNEMSKRFAEWGLAAPKSEPIDTPQALRSFAARVPYPILIKPAVGVGAEGALRINDDAELSRALERPLEGYVAQEFVQGKVTSFDGLCDANGEIVFFISFIYCAGVMEILTQQLDVSYYSRRAIPASLEAMGRRMVKAFDLRSTFFHGEFFELEDGTYRALEMNLRPPGGLTTHLMNFACDIDVYALWADVLLGRDLSKFTYEYKYHAAHVSRRPTQYVHDHATLVSLLGDGLKGEFHLPSPISNAMGSPVYLLRDPDLTELQRMISEAHRRAM